MNVIEDRDVKKILARGITAQAKPLPHLSIRPDHTDLKIQRFSL